MHPRFSMLALLGLSLLLQTACSSWQDRNPSSQQRRNKERAQSEMSFTAYGTYSPSRKKGGEWQTISFESPKTLSEISFEFINFPVRLHKVEVITITGQRLPIPALSQKFLRTNSAVLAFDGLHPDLKISSLRFQAEGYENSAVQLTIGLFSPDGFSPKEQKLGLSTKSVNAKSAFASLEASAPSHATPDCHKKDEDLKDYLFNFEELKSTSSARYFCQKFVPQFKAWVKRNPKDSSFLKEGHPGERPLIVLSQRFAYDPLYKEIFMPLQFNQRQSATLSSLIQTGRDQKPATRIAGDLQYEEFMDKEIASSEFTYAGDWGLESSSLPSDYCEKQYRAKGINKSIAGRYCQQVQGFEAGHFDCLDRLSDAHFPLTQAHSSCLEARGKWSSYLPCVDKMSDLKFSPYDSHQFCTRTPESYMTSQVKCVEKLRSQEFSAYLSLQSCQQHWGKEERLLNCLDSSQRQPANDDERLSRCTK